MSKIKLFILLLLLFSFCFGINLKAEENMDLSSTGNANDVSIGVPFVSVYEAYYSKSDTIGGLVFLFSPTKLSNKHKGYVVALFSSIEVSGEYTGDIYSFFSDIRITETASGSLTVNTLSSKVTAYQNELSDINITSIIKALEIFENSGKLEGNVIKYSSEIPNIVIQFILAVFNIVACMLMYQIKKSFMKQGSVLLSYEPLNVIKNGIVFFGVTLGLIIVTALTVFLIPVSGFVFIVMSLVMLVGETSISAFIGHTILDSLHLKVDALTCMGLGVIIIEAAKMVPYVGFGLNFVFLPILTLGIVATGLINGFIKKVFYATPFDNIKKSTEYDSNKMRGIILK